jgi:hypothetical protein
VICTHFPLFFFPFSEAQQILDCQAVGTPKSGLVAEGRQGFHLHTSGVFFFFFFYKFWGRGGFGTNEKNFIAKKAQRTQPKGL